MKNFFKKILRRQKPETKLVEESTKSSTASESNDERKEIIEPPPVDENMSRIKNPRKSVFTESSDVVTNFIPPVYPKSAEQREEIKKTIENCFLFNTLEDDASKLVFDAFQLERIVDGTVLMKQGEEGEKMYVVATGKFEGFKTEQDATEEKKVAELKQGDLMGELALLYNTPRAATVVAVEDSVVWSLDRQSFIHIVRDSARQRRAKYDEFLSRVELLKDMDCYERSKLGDALKTTTYEANQDIITQGSVGKSFFILVSGDAVAKKNGEEVMKYKEGDYFGELALLRDEPRAATVTAISAAKCVSMDRRSFNRLLGPVESILKRNMKRYSVYYQ